MEEIHKIFTKEVLERRNKILELIKKVGLWNIDTKLLAKQFEVSTRTIFKDLNWIKGHYRPKDIKEIKIQMNVIGDRIVNEALIAATNQDPKIKIQAIDLLIKAQKSYREELENWGYKEKIADKHEHNIRGYRFELIEVPSTAEQKAEASSNDTPRQ
jgi:hypothetical protein